MRTAPAVVAPPPELASDEELVASLADQSSAALRELYRRYNDAVTTSAVRVLHDVALAADVRQDVFLRLWRDPDCFDRSRGSLVSFLCLLARRRALDLMRTTVSRDRREILVAGSTATSHDDQQSSASASNAHVRAALESLDVAQRRPIELAFFNGHSYREVATLLGEPEGTVKSRIRAGLLKLRAALVDDVDVPDAAGLTLAAS